MPAVPSPTELLERTLVHRSTSLSPHNTTAPGLEVVCAWPVSGQYGPGTRALYYALIAACVFARKREWIRSACLAGALLFPAVAALHGIVLAALHREGAVDMDVYGAFQLCAIGILAAPVTVRLSKTYFDNPGRDIIFLWTGLLLAGLLSLIVEFIRIEPTTCPPDDPAAIQWVKNGTFSYNSRCGMTCEENNPSSPLRQGAANNINVIPIPQQLTFNTATLVAAACCIPAILSLISTWIKILEKNWEKISHKDRQDGNPDEKPIDGTNGATPRQMSGIAIQIRGWLMLIEIPVFGAAILAILIKGEMNLFSKQMMYQTEPIASIGQWAPIVGTGLAAIGSLYLLLATDMADEEKEEAQSEYPPDEGVVERCSRCSQCAVFNENREPGPDPRWSFQSNDEQPSPTKTRADTEVSASTTVRRAVTNQSEKSIDPGGRRQVARFLNMASRQLAAKAHTHIEDSGFNARERATFPVVPGEFFRNIDLPEIQRAYSNSPIPGSRAGSSVNSFHSDSSNDEDNPQPTQISTRQLSLPPTPKRPERRKKHANSLPSRGSSSEITRFRDFAFSYGNPSARQESTREQHEQQASGAPSAAEMIPAPSPSDGQDIPPRIVISSCVEEEGHTN